MAPKKKAAAAAAVATEEEAPKVEDTKEEMETDDEVKNGKDAGDAEVEDQVEESPEEDEENGKEEEEPEPVKKGRGRKPKAAPAEKKEPAKRGRPGKRAAEKTEEASSDDKEQKEVEAPKRGKKKGTKKTEPETEDDKEEEEVKEKKEDAEERPRRGNRAQKINYNENTVAGQPKKRKVANTEEPPKKEKEPALVNKTETDFSQTDFTCSKKNALGAKSNFKISSWNVDGVRAWCKKQGYEYIENEDPDILCLQETKCSEDKVPEEIDRFKDYKKYWLLGEKEGYAGVSLLSKTEPLNVTYGIGDKEQDREGRCITAEFKNFFVVSVYVPNAGRKLITLPKRLEWNKAFKTFILNLDKSKPVIICGDMNVAHEEIDLANPKTNKKNAGFTQEERDGMTDFLGSGFVDTFRKFYPDQEKAYTFWTYMMKARTKNTGWRLDYFIVSERYCENICDNVIRSEVFGSDHCPITLHLHV